MNQSRKTHLPRFFLLLLGMAATLPSDGGEAAPASATIPYEQLPEFRQLNFARKLFKLHRPEAVQLQLTPASENQREALQKEIGTELKIIEGEVRALDHLVDQQAELTPPVTHSKSTENRLLCPKRGQRVQKNRIDLRVPKFDPIMKSMNTLKIYNAKMRKNFSRNALMGGSSDLNDLIARNAPILKQLPPEGQGIRSHPALRGKMFVLQPNSRPFLNRSWKAKKLRGAAKNSSDTFYELLERPHPAAGLPRYRPSGDVIAQINRRYTRRNMARRQVPIHDLKEEYRNSAVALDQFFGPVLPKKQRQRRRKATRVRPSQQKRLKKISQLNRSQTALKNGFWRIKRSKRRVKQARVTPNFFQSFFRGSNRPQRRQKIDLPVSGEVLKAQDPSMRHLPILGDGKGKAPFFSLRGLGAKKQVSFKKQATQNVSPLLNDLFALKALREEGAAMGFPTLGHKHGGRFAREPPFVPTLTRLFADRRKIERKNALETRKISSLHHRQAKADSLRSELDSFLSELGQAGPKGAI